MLVRLIYASKSTSPVNDEMISQILAQSRQRNPDAGITGVLCVCSGDVFMQVIEGSREEANKLYARLVQDPRHTNVTILDYAEVHERRFSSWRMGKVEVNKLNTGIVLKYSEKPTFDPFAISGRVALAFLEELISTASIVGGS